MKNKAFFILCLLSGFGLTQLSAQKGMNEMRSIPEFSVWDGYFIDIPVECKNVDVDRLIGLVNLHVVRHFKKGNFTGENVWYSGEVTSEMTGEVFSIKDVWKYDVTTFGSGHCNLKGSSGSHYLLFYKYDPDSNSFTFTKAVCN